MKICERKHPPREYSSQGSVLCWLPQAKQMKEPS
jgi:hypothetical protein